MSEPLHLALLVGDFSAGGVERTLTNLALGLAGLGQRVDLLVGDRRQAYLRSLPASVRVLRVAGGARQAPDDDGVAPVALGDYLAQERPAILLTGKLADDRAALAAVAGMADGDRPLVQRRTRLVATVGTPLSVRLGEGRNPIRSWWTRRQLVRDYRRLDGITAVSAAVADDLRRLGITGLPLRVLCNPVVPDDLDLRLATAPLAPPPHRWLADDAPPVIIAIGGLRRVKDFPTLLRAVARLDGAPAPRLLLLGEGGARARLTALATRLGIAARVALPGFVADPYPWLRHARVLALSSRREGLGNVLVEAMAVGIPVVATDCPGGVRGLLDHGRFGRLVPVGDDRALAAAISATLAEPTDPATLQQAAAPYRIGTAAAAYLAFFRELLI